MGRALELVRERAGDKRNTAAMTQAVTTAAAAEEVLRPAPALPVHEALSCLLPWQGLRRGTVVTVTGSAMLTLALLARASEQGSWCAAVGMPDLGMVAAHEAGIDLARFALVPQPGPQWADITAVLLDGFDIVLYNPAAPPSGRVAANLAARARQRGAVLLPTTDTWPQPDLALTVSARRWHGLGLGHGRLRHVDLDITTRGRGAAGRPRDNTIRLPLSAEPAVDPVAKRHLRAV